MNAECEDCKKKDQEIEHLLVKISKQREHVVNLGAQIREAESKQDALREQLHSLRCSIAELLI